MAAVSVSIPKLGWEMQDGFLVSWLVEDGAVVAQGDALYELETNKVEQTIEAPASGVVRIKETAGETYPIGHLIAEIVEA